jgi:CRP-like cAMP-binding protein
MIRIMSTILAELAGPAARLRALAAGEVLFRTGDPARAVFEVAEGGVRLVRHTPGGEQITIHAAGAGESFAEAALFAGAYHCDAVADRPSRVLVYPKSALRAAFRHDPSAALAFAEHLAHQVQRLRARLELVGQRSARARVLGYLHLLAGGAATLTLDRTWKTVATELGLSHEALYRTLAALERDGAIRRIGKGVVRLGGD